jgi:hypothetical protein
MSALASALTRPLPRIRWLECLLLAVATVLPWLVLAWPSLLASAIAVLLVRRVQGGLTAANAPGLA